jgi:hypothetical protein
LRTDRKGRNNKPVIPKRTRVEISAQAAVKKDAKEHQKHARKQSAIERRLREEQGVEVIADAELEIDNEAAHDEAYMQDALEAAFDNVSEDDNDDADGSDEEVEPEQLEEDDTLPEPRKVSATFLLYYCTC